MAFAVATIGCFVWSVISKTRRKLAITALILSFLLCLFSFQQAAWYM